MKNTPRFLSRSLFALAGLVSSAWNGLLRGNTPSPAAVSETVLDALTTGTAGHAPRYRRARRRRDKTRRKNPIPSYLRTGELVARHVKG